MILRAAEMLGLDLAGSWVVGDRAIDLEAARQARIKREYLACALLATLADTVVTRRRSAGLSMMTLSSGIRVGINTCST